MAEFVLEEKPLDIPNPLVGVPKLTPDSFSGLEFFQMGCGANSIIFDIQTGLYLGGETFLTAPFSVSMAGKLKATDFDFTGGTITNPVISGLAQGSLLNIQGWTSTMTFTATDYRTVAWTSGAISLADGTTFSILTGNTGNMAAGTYIYFDKAVSETVLQTTTTAATAVGANKILIAFAKNNSDVTGKAILQVFGGSGGLVITPDMTSIASINPANGEINANKVGTTQIDNNAVTEAKILNDAITANKIYAGAVTAQKLTTYNFLLSAGTFTNNSPTLGYVAWASCKVMYNGTEHTITNGNSNKKHIYWQLASPTVFASSDTLPALGNDDFLVSFNDTGTNRLVWNSTVINGNRITAGSIVASNLAAGTITANEIASNTITASQIKANTITAAEIAANTITAAEIAANTITANEIAANTITASQIKAGTITASEISANGISGRTIKATGGASGVDVWMDSTDGNLKFYYNGSAIGKILTDASNLIYQAPIHFFGSNSAQFAQISSDGLILPSNKELIFTAGGRVQDYGSYLRICGASGGVMNLNVKGNVYPNSDNTHQCGTSDKRWQDVNSEDAHIDDIYIGDRIFSSDGSQGIDSGSKEFVTTMRYDSGAIEYKHRSYTFKDGLLVAVGDESGWHRT